MVPVTSGSSQYDRLGKKGFSPKGDETPAVEMTRMDCPDPQRLNPLSTIMHHLLQNIRGRNNPNYNRYRVCQRVSSRSMQSCFLP
jgi:hypothetical protein